MFIDFGGTFIVIPKSSDRAAILKMINCKALGTFAINETTGRLYLLNSNGDATKYSTYYRDRLILAIGDPDVIAIKIGTSYVDPNTKKTEPISKAGEGITLSGFWNVNTKVTDPVNATETTTTTQEPYSDVIISGKENTSGLSTGCVYKVADILLHELVGHAIPNTVGSDTGNAIKNDNKARQELGEVLRTAEPEHVE